MYRLELLVIKFCISINVISANMKALHNPVQTKRHVTKFVVGNCIFDMTDTTNSPPKIYRNRYSGTDDVSTLRDCVVIGEFVLFWVWFWVLLFVLLLFVLFELLLSSLSHLSLVPLYTYPVPQLPIQLDTLLNILVTLVTLSTCILTLSTNNNPLSHPEQ